MSQEKDFAELVLWYLTTVEQGHLMNKDEIRERVKRRARDILYEEKLKANSIRD